ncbi:MAG: hypothetical protein LBW77_01675 [Verrucomicrobiota bacterium]|jgi:hypothetical protein|nr:hypothetical protein [Verrucomicrobiota bacterium]
MDTHGLTTELNEAARENRCVLRATLDVYAKLEAAEAQVAQGRVVDAEESLKKSGRNTVCKGSTDELLS